MYEYARFNFIFMVNMKILCFSCNTSADIWRIILEVHGKYWVDISYVPCYFAVISSLLSSGHQFGSIISPYRHIEKCPSKESAFFCKICVEFRFCQCIKVLPCEYCRVSEWNPLVFQNIHKSCNFLVNAFSSPLISLFFSAFSRKHRNNIFCFPESFNYFFVNQSSICKYLKGRSRVVVDNIHKLTIYEWFSSKDCI